MAFPDGLSTRRVHLTVTNPVGGGAASGKVRLAPNVPAVVIEGVEAQFTGAGTYTFDNQGRLVDSDGTTVGVEILDNSVAGSNPVGWLWHAIVSVDNQAPHSFYFTLAGTGPDVDLRDVMEIDPEVPRYVAVPGPRGPAGADGQNGAPGAAGASAYQEWLAAGHTGSESEFLASLVGPAGSPGAPGSPGTPGAPGSPGAPGADGQDGASAYEVAVADGFSGTEADWLASLVGPAGAAGGTGPKGDPGDTGPEGPAGPQPPLGDAGAGPTIALKSDDPTTTNARTPTAHASSHAAAGPDAITPESIGAAGLADDNVFTGTVIFNNETPVVPARDAEFDNQVIRLAQLLNLINTRAPKPAYVFDVTDYGAKGDARVVADGAMSAGVAVLTSATANWPSDIAGKAISVKGAGPNGVTTLVTTVASRQSSTQITLNTANASGGAVSGAIVIFGTDDTAAIQAATDAAEAYLAAGNTYAQVYFPPRPYIVAGPLNNTRSGNGQIVFGPVATTGVKRILEFRGVTDGAAAVRHWQQTVPQYAGSCLISLGVYSSTSAQIANINADGNPAVLCGPNEGWGYGVAAAFSNMQTVVTNLAIVTSHSSFGLTYGALNLYGVANAHLENVGYGTAGVVPGTDYTSPGVFGTGLSIGMLLPAPGNNDHVVAKNVGCGGGYTYAAFVTEHLMMDRYMALYCWAGLVAVGTYFGSVGSVHAMKVLSASIEACVNELYIMGAGSSGIGPIVDIDQLSTESSTPNINGQAAHMAAARGIVRWTGLFTEAGLTHDQPTGIESINGQATSPVRTVTATTTARPIDRIIKADATSGGITVNLPSASPNPVAYTIIKADASGNTVTVDPAGSQTINGSATRVLSAQWETVTLRSDGTNWIAI